VPLISAKFDVRKIRGQAEQPRIDEARGVVDDAGDALTDAIFALDEAVTALGNTAGTGTDWTPAAPAIDALEQRVKALWRWNKLAVRVGDKSEVHAAHSDATYAAQRAMFVVSSVKGGAAFGPTAQRIVSDEIRVEATRAQTRSTMPPRRSSGSSVSVASSGGRAERCEQPVSSHRPARRRSGDTGPTWRSSVGSENRT
jgi:hypothetical protein